MARRRVTAEPDTVFLLAGEQDPFTGEVSPYLNALARLPLVQRKAVARQVVLLCAVMDGLDPLGALELLASLAPFVGMDLQ